MNQDDPGPWRRGAYHGAIWVGAERWTVRAFSLIVLVVLSRELSSSEFGLVALATSVVAMAQVLADLGVGRIVVRDSRLNHTELSTLFWLTGIVGVLIAAAVVALALPLQLIFGEPGIFWPLIILALTIPVNALGQVPVSLLERRMEFRTLASRQVVAAVAGGIVAVSLALMGFGVWALVLQLIAASALGTGIALFTAGFRAQWVFQIAILKERFAAMRIFVFLDAVDSIQAYGDKLILGLFFEPQIIGVYFLAQRFILMIYDVASAALSRVSLATFSKSQDDPRAQAEIYTELTYISTIVGSLLYGLFFVSAPVVIPILVGGSWEGLVSATQAFCVVSVLISVVAHDRGLLVSRDAQSFALGISVVQNGFYVLALIFAAPFGLIAAIVCRVAPVLVLPLRIYYVQRVIPIQLKAYSEFARPMVLSIIVFSLGGALVNALVSTEASGVFLPLLAVALISLIHVAAAVLEVRLFGPESLRKALIRWLWRR